LDNLPDFLVNKTSKEEQGGPRKTAHYTPIGEKRKYRRMLSSAASKGTNPWIAINSAYPLLTHSQALFGNA
jgi:hypothetical protein